MSPEELEAWFDELEASLEERFHRVYQSLPGEGASGREAGDLHSDLWWLWQEARKGLEPRRKKALSSPRGPKSDLKEQVLISAVDYVVSLGLNLEETNLILFGPEKIGTHELLDGTLRELEKYDDRFQGDDTEGRSKTVRNILGQKHMRYMILCEAGELIRARER